MSDLSASAHALLARARGEFAPLGETVERIRESVHARIAAGDTYAASSAPPPNTAAMLARTPWWAAVLVALSIAMPGAPRISAARSGVIAHSAISRQHVRDGIQTASVVSAGNVVPTANDAPAPNVVAGANVVSSVRARRVAMLARLAAPSPATLGPRVFAGMRRPASGPVAFRAARQTSVSTPAVVTPEAPASDAMGTALRLYQQERYEPAAVLFQRVAEGGTGDALATAQRAQFFLGKCLVHLRLDHAALSVFDEILESGTTHAYFEPSLPWLAQLAIRAADPGDVARRLRAFTPEQLARFDTDDQRTLYFDLSYLLGRARYEDGRFAESIALFQRVRPGATSYVPARFFEGIAQVRLHRSQPAVAAFREVVDAIEHGVPGIAERDRYADLAWLELARVYYSTRHYASAIDAWDHLHVDSEYWLDAQFEEAWAYFLTHDDARALGNIHTLNGPYFTNRHYPESLVLRAVILFSSCQLDAAEAAVAEFQRRHGGTRAQLEQMLERWVGTDGGARIVSFLRSMDGGTNVAAASADARSLASRAVVDTALADRRIRRDLEELARVESEVRRVRELAGATRESSLGARLLAELAVARDRGVETIGDRVRGRFRRAADELRDLENQATSISIEVLATRRGDAENEMRGQQVRSAGHDAMPIVAVDELEEGFEWPFTGEYWRDEQGTYRQRVPNRCAR